MFDIVSRFHLISEFWLIMSTDVRFWFVYSINFNVRMCCFCLFLVFFFQVMHKHIKFLYSNG